MKPAERLVRNRTPHLLSGTELGIRIGPRVLAESLCAKITDFEAMLRTDEPARQRFMAAGQRPEFKPKGPGVWTAPQK
jgi:hypothetical protein